VIGVGQRDVERVTDHRDVGDLIATRHPVERRMSLDEPTVRLPLEEAEYLVVGADQHVEPGRERADRRPEVDAVEEQHPHDRLHPGRAALGRRRDHDGAGSEREPLPPRAVRHDAPVPPHAATLA
jgi:hypothetical protein